LKLLFDENLSARLVALLAREFPGSIHVDQCGLHGDSDRAVWEFAATHGFTIISKDSDFRELSAVLGMPPKVVWLRIGNASSARVHEVLLAAVGALERFASDPDDAVLILSQPERLGS
jgi:predicted nuclease of predicted toxin-antitoxin system